MTTLATVITVVAAGSLLVVGIVVAWELWNLNSPTLAGLGGEPFALALLVAAALGAFYIGSLGVRPKQRGRP